MPRFALFQCRSAVRIAKVLRTRPEQPSIYLIQFGEYSMSALLYDTASADHCYIISMTDGRQSVSNHDHRERFILHELAERSLHVLLALIIQC